MLVIYIISYRVDIGNQGYREDTALHVWKIWYLGVAYLYLCMCTILLQNIFIRSVFMFLFVTYYNILVVFFNVPIGYESHERLHRWNNGAQRENGHSYRHY